MIGATINHVRLSAIISVNDSQGWRTLNSPVTINAIFDRIQMVAINVYTLIVDKLSFSDDVLNSDGIIFTVTKGVSDNIITLEGVIFDAKKVLSDNQLQNETVIFSANKGLSENQTISDNQAFEMGKVLNENQASGDSTIFNMTAKSSGSINDITVNSTTINASKTVTRIF